MTGEKDLIKAACRKIGCEEKDLLNSRVTAEAVILIVGPVGFKKIISLADLDTPAPVKAQAVVEDKPPAKAKATATKKKSKSKK